MALNENRISPKDLQVLQNIQDVCHNCTKLKVPQDDLLKTTTYLAHELDNKKNHKNDEHTIVFFIRLPTCYNNGITMDSEKYILLSAV